MHAADELHVLGLGGALLDEEAREAADEERHPEQQVEADRETYQSTDT